MTGPRVLWVDGVLADEHDPRVRVSPFDHAVLTGDGVFETLRVYGGVPFAARRHLHRLRRSADGLRLSGLPGDDALRAAMVAVIEANGLDEARVRITVTGGPAPLGSARGPDGPTTVVAAGPLDAPAASTDVVLVPWPRNERGALTGLKTVSYAENVVALAWAAERGAGEALFGNLAGDLCEGTGSNVFVVVGGRVLTPPLAAGCLAGVTRELLLELGHGEEADVPLTRLGDVEEAFLSSTTREAQPIRALDGRALPSCPGPATSAAAAAFAELVARDPDP